MSSVSVHHPRVRQIPVGGFIVGSLEINETGPQLIHQRLLSKMEMDHIRAELVYLVVLRLQQHCAFVKQASFLRTACTCMAWGGDFRIMATLMEIAFTILQPKYPRRRKKHKKGPKKRAQKKVSVCLYIN
jgi:predicted membrane protein